jgi:hypothetical protein
LHLKEATGIEEEQAVILPRCTTLSFVIPNAVKNLRLILITSEQAVMHPRRLSSNAVILERSEGPAVAFRNFRIAGDSPRNPGSVISRRTLQPHFLVTWVCV